MVIKDLIKSAGKDSCHFIVNYPYPDNSRFDEPIPMFGKIEHMTSTIKGFLGPCSCGIAGEVNGIPLCQEHLSYVKALSGAR